VKSEFAGRLLTSLTHTHTHTPFVSYTLRGPTQPYFRGCPNLRQSLLTGRFQSVRTSSSATIGSVSEVLTNPPFSIFYTDQNSAFISNFSYACQMCQNKLTKGTALKAAGLISSPSRYCTQSEQAKSAVSYFVTRQLLRNSTVSRKAESFAVH
jgi:predicted RNA methylase